MCQGEMWRKKLLVVFMESIYLRKLVSLSVRVTDISMEDLNEMENVARKLFKIHCIHDSSMTPSFWTFCIIAPANSRSLFEKFGLGLGANSMEGREQKHQKIKTYMFNSTVNERWHFVFRHEYISCVYLRENGFDQKKYNKKIIPYVPLLRNGHCPCGLEFNSPGICEICNCSEYSTLYNSIN